MELRKGGFALAHSLKGQHVMGGSGRGVRKMCRGDGEVMTQKEIEVVGHLSSID